jgi:hypothetical protein
MWKLVDPLSMFFAILIVESFLQTVKNHDLAIFP